MKYGNGETGPGGWLPSNDTDGWRGEGHLACWPEELAGPEYWAYRNREEIEDVISGLVGKRTAKERR